MEKIGKENILGKRAHFSEEKKIILNIHIIGKEVEVSLRLFDKFQRNMVLILYEEPLHLN